MNEEIVKIDKGELAALDSLAKSILMYSEDDRRKADDLYLYYQELITNGDSKGETRVALAKALELKEDSVKNLIDIMKLRTRLIEKKMTLEIKKIVSDVEAHSSRGIDTNEIIARMEKDDDDE